MSGPWEVGQHPAIPNGYIVKPVLFGNRVRVLPECEGGHVVLLERDAAHLIAAAPELLDQLERMAGFYSTAIGTDRNWEAARAAIAKAKGEQA